MRYRLFAATALAAAAACDKAPAPKVPARPSAVLIVTIDTLRADRVGIYGASTVATPNIDRLAREGAWAPQADVHVPLTRPSHVSLFTGRYPAEHGIRDNISAPLAANVPVLAEAFQRAGFPTAAFVASSVLDRQSGLARGFDDYADRFEDGADRRSGDRVVADAIAWIAPHAAAGDAANGRFFAWVHLYDPHAPYAPPEPYASRYAGRPYDGTVAWSDDLVGRLAEALRSRGVLDRTLVVVTSDHGEALGDHGEDVHGYFVYEATLRVPLVMRGPGIAPGSVLRGVVRTIDLYPTIAELAGVAADASSGRSLTAALTGGAANPDPPSFAESLVPRLHYGWSDLHALRDGRWKFILAPRPELYDLDRDPGEQHNVAPAEPSRARAMRAAIETQHRLERPVASAPASAMSSEAVERLGALGYVGAGASAGSPSRGADPKDMLADYKALSAAMQNALVAMRAGRYQDAVDDLRQVERHGIDSFELHYYRGRAYAALQRWPQAAADYEKATERLPGGAEAWRGLGESRVVLRDGHGSVRAFERLVALAPGDAVARMELGEAYRDVARYDDAAKVIREALVIDPRPAQYWNSLGTVLGASRKMADAERAFGEAATRDPRNGAYAYNRALALQQLGRTQEAAALMTRAAELGYRK
jgi:choline-sulfatase